jgi:hypothetical protein
MENIPWDKIAIGVFLDNENDTPAEDPLKPLIWPGLSCNSVAAPRQDYWRPHYSQPAIPPEQAIRPAQHRNSRATAPPPTPSSIIIEVGPGVSAPLRGSDETWKAIEDGRVTITSCTWCQIELNCLDDAQLVICPDCTMISPVDQTAGQDNSPCERYGVGVGIKPEEIVKWIKSHM